MSKTVTVPGRGQKWRTGSILRDGATLYRVTGSPVLYHVDCLPHQPVAQVRQLPDEWVRCRRLMEIMDIIRWSGTHTPASRGASASNRPTAELPALNGEPLQWVARDDARSLASYPTITLRGDVVVYRSPQYDDADTIAWTQDADLAGEVAGLIKKGTPSPSYWTRANVRGGVT